MTGVEVTLPQWPWRCQCLPPCSRLAKCSQNRRQRGQSQSPWGKERGCPGSSYWPWSPTGMHWGPSSCTGGKWVREQHSVLPRAMQAECWQSLARPRMLGSRSLGAPSLSSAPAAGCPRVNETLLLLQTISDIFADNATLSSSLEASPAAPAWPPPHPTRPPHYHPPSLLWSHHPTRHLVPAPHPGGSSAAPRHNCNPERAAGSPRCPLTRCCCGNCIPRRITEPESSAGSKLPSKSRRPPATPPARGAARGVPACACLRLLRWCLGAAGGGSRAPGCPGLHPPAGDAVQRCCGVTMMPSLTPGISAPPRCRLSIVSW